MTAQIAQTEQALDTAQAAVEKKQKELQSLQKQTKEQRTAALTVQEIRSMGKKTITGNITLTPSECSTLKDYAVNGILDVYKRQVLPQRITQMPQHLRYSDEHGCLAVLTSQSTD